MQKFKDEQSRNFQHQQVAKDVKNVMEGARSTGLSMDGATEKQRISRAKKNAGKRKMTWDKIKGTFVEETEEMKQESLAKISGTAIIMNTPGDGMGRTHYKGKRVT